MLAVGEAPPVVGRRWLVLVAPAGLARGSTSTCLAIDISGRDLEFSGAHRPGKIGTGS